MLIRTVSESLRMQLLCAVLLSLLIGSAVFGVAFMSGNMLLDKTVYGHSFAEKMAEQQFKKLQDYVDEKSITLDTLQRLNVWCSRGEKVYLAIYKDNELVYESHVSDTKSAIPGTKQNSPDIEDPDSEFILCLTDNVQLRAFLYYYAGDAFYFLMTVVSGFLAFLAFSMFFIMLISRKIAYIGQLKQELDILSGGQLEYNVSVIGKDELGELAMGIDQMRRSIIHHQEREKQMRSANSELITAMSHDLRTPLTSLLAYLEVVERKKYADDEQMHRLIHKSLLQTMRIKQMADKLFSYFWAYSTEWEALELETVDADALFHQIISDYAYELEDKGMSTEMKFEQTGAKINVNIELLQRAMDNIYSNLLKYAAPKTLISFSLKREKNNLLLSISNVVSSSKEKGESTGIGLITCRRIIEHHNGCFSAEDCGSCFFVSISLPVMN